MCQKTIPQEPINTKQSPCWLLLTFFWNSKLKVAKKKKNVDIRLIRTYYSSLNEMLRKKGNEKFIMNFLDIKQKHRMWLCILFDFSHMELYEQRFSFIMMFSKQVCFKATEFLAMQRFGLPCLPGSLQITPLTAKTHKESGQVHTMFGNFLTFKCFGCSFNTVLNPFLFNLPSQVFCFFNLKRKV